MKQYNFKSISCLSNKEVLEGHQENGTGGTICHLSFLCKRIKLSLTFKHLNVDGGTWSYGFHFTSPNYFMFMFKMVAIGRYRRDTSCIMLEGPTSYCFCMCC